MAGPYLVCVVGVGELGTRIAGELSLYGIDVRVYDKDTKKIRNANYEILEQREELIRNNLIICTDMPGNVTTYTNISEALQEVDFVFEAVIDDLEIKQKLFEEITHNCKSDTVVCSNTLQINVEELSESSLFKNRVIGCRFMMPVYRIPLVEVMYTPKTSQDIIEKVKSFFQSIEKRILVRTFHENPKLLTLSETKHFWKEAKLHVEERRSAAQHKKLSHGCPTNVNKMLDDDDYDEVYGKEEYKKQKSCVSTEDNIEALCLSNTTEDSCTSNATESAEIELPNIHPETSPTTSRSVTFSDELDEGGDTPNECILCNDAQINCVIVPCGHMWLCYECGVAVKKSGKGCPACRETIHQIVRAFLP